MQTFIFILLLAGCEVLTLFLTFFVSLLYMGFKYRREDLDDYTTKLEAVANIYRVAWYITTILYATMCAGIIERIFTLWADTR